MATKPTTLAQDHHGAKAIARNLGISTKHCVEISHELRYRTTTEAKKILEEVIALRTPVPFRRFRRDVGHKAGQASGRYPQKAARQFLRLIHSVEANAHTRGLDTTRLKITKLVANRASSPPAMGRFRGHSKRSHIEVEVMEKTFPKTREKSSPSPEARSTKTTTLPRKPRPSKTQSTEGKNKL